MSLGFECRDCLSLRVCDEQNIGEWPALMPVFGMAVGAASGALAGKLTDIGINDKFMKDVAAALEPGSAAVFALVRRSTPDRVREALKPYQPTVIIHTSLTRDKEDELVQALAG